jgi:sugar lactone lactonase YvrE
MRPVLALCALLLTGWLLPAVAQQDVMTTAIGGGPNNIPATNADIYSPNGLALDAAGNYYIAAYNANRVYKVGTSGILTLVAGNGIAGESGDGVSGGAANAELRGPVGVAVDASGNVYIAEIGGCVVRKVDTTNTITTIAGSPGSCGYGGDGGSGTSAKLNGPRGIAMDTAGNLYIADTSNCRVRKLVLSTNIISTYAGNGTCSFLGDGGAAASAELSSPSGVAVDSAGDLFIADFNNYRIREVTISNGNINTVAGTGGDADTGDGMAATSAAIGQVYQGVAVNSAGTLVTITDFNHAVIRQFTVGGDINTVAGTGVGGFSGDGGPADAARFNGPLAVVVNSSGLIYVADQNNNRIRAFTVAGIPNTATINTTAGNGNATYPTLVTGVAPSGMVLNNPYDVLVDPSGNIFVSDNGNCMVFEQVKSSGLVNIFAGSAASGATAGTCGFSGVGGPATSAELGNVAGIARDSTGNMYIADVSNCVVWQVSATNGDISVFAGANPRSCGFSGDGGPATSARLNAPEGLFMDTKSNLYIADSSNERIREVSAGIINTIAGNGVPGYLGDGTPATDAELSDPGGVAVDSAGNVYIADYNNCLIREVTAANGVINSIAGTGACSFNGDGLAIEREINHPDRVTLDANGNLFIADDFGQRVRWVNPTGIMTTIAGNGNAGFNGDGNLATTSELNYIVGIAQDALGDYLIADQNNHRIRRVSTFSALNASVTSADFGLVTVGATSTPQVLTLSAMGPVTIYNISITGPFKEADNCSELANAATCKVWLTFTPSVAGNATGAITIEDNGFFSNITTVSLQGTGSAISVTGGPLLFGNQGVNTTSAAKVVTVTNSGSASVTMGAISLTESDFAISANTCPASGSALAAGTKCTVSIDFAPKTTGAKKSGLVVRDSDPSTPQIVGMSGTATSLVVLSPSSLTFPATAVGVTSAASKITLTNNTAASLTLGNPAVTVTPPFANNTAGTGCTNGRVIAAGQQCVISLILKPTAVGFVNGTLSVADSDSTSPQTVALSGAGTGVQFTPSQVTLSGPVGTQVSTSVTLTNVGASTIAFTAAAIIGPNKADWGVNAPCNETLAPGAFCTLTVYFTPSILGAESATYVVYDNSTGSPQSLPLSGTGQ